MTSAKMIQAFFYFKKLELSESDIPFLYIPIITYILLDLLIFVYIHTRTEKLIEKQRARDRQIERWMGRQEDKQKNYRPIDRQIDGQNLDKKYSSSVKHI